MLEQALQEYLYAEASIVAIVGTDGVYVGARHFNAADDLPAITIERPTASRADDRLQELSGEEVDLQFPHFEFVIHALLSEDSIRLARAVRRSLHSIRNGTTVTVTDPDTGNPATVTIEQVDVLAEFDDPPDDMGHGLTDRARVLRVRVGWRETVTGI